MRPFSQVYNAFCLALAALDRLRLDYLDVHGDLQVALELACEAGFQLLELADLVERVVGNGLDLQLEPQGTTDDETRRAAGNAVQVEIFGEQMRESWEHCPEDRKLINSWLAEYCFGSFYTRTGLSLADRELVTFCILAGMGFCEKQLDAHIQGNLNVGNDRAFLVKVTMQIMPYIGFPRTLNTLDAIDRVCPAE